MPVTVRTIDEGDLEAFSRQVSFGFGATFRPERLERLRKLADPARNLAARDGDLIVGTAGSFATRMAVPGEYAPREMTAAGVTMVTVLSTHRRRGVLTEMMRTQVEDVRARGETAAALWASEAPIYGRFGYGLAVSHLGLEIERPYAVLSAPADERGRVRIVQAEEAQHLLPKVWERERRQRPGMIARSAELLSDILVEDPPWYAGWNNHTVVVYERDGEALGHARYRVKPDDRDGLPAGRLLVNELVAPDRAAYIALWRYLFGVDLMATFEAEARPLDEPLHWLLPDPRRLRKRVSDAIWLRLVDIPAALEARTYSAEGTLVIEVEDRFLPGWGGRYRLEAGPGGAACVPTTLTAGLAMGVAALGAIFLGGASPLVLHEAGLIEGDRDQVLLTERMFRPAVVPWCPEHF